MTDRKRRLRAARRPVRKLVFATFIASALANAVVFLILIALIGFDLEDDIFDDQVSTAADQLALNPTEGLGRSGTVSTLDMRYFVGTGEMPGWLRASDPIASGAERGEIFAEDRGHFHLVTRQLTTGETLYVLFDARPFIRSTPQIASYMGIALVMALIAFVASLVFLRRMISALSDPLEALSSRISWTTTDLAAPYPVAEQAPAEVYLLATALHERDLRIAQLLERERAFNRDASHELRTPLAVAAGALELVEEKSGPSAAILRLHAALADMRRLIDGILWLGREPDPAASSDARSVVAASIEGHRHLLQGRDCPVHVDVEQHATIPVPREVSMVLVGNLLRNAIAHAGDGPIAIHIHDARIVVRDSGSEAGVSSEGFGIGLSLVQRLGNHFGVAIELLPRAGGGTDAILRWPE